MRLSLASLMTMLLATPAASGTLAGDWETVIESARRPWIFESHFERTPEGWSGVMRVPGYGELPLSGVLVDGDRVRFTLPPQLDSLAFEGSYRDSTITGLVTEDGSPDRVRLTRIVPLPKPANRVQAWRQDLDYAAKHMLAYDRSFSPEARDAFARSIAAIESDLPHLDDARILAALSRAVALADNAHTRVRLDPTTQGDFTTELPMACWWFEDGLFVIRAAPGYERALRCQVVAVEGQEMAQVRRQVKQLFAGNDAWAHYLTPLYLMSPDVLHGLGIAPSKKEVRLTLENGRGQRFDQVVHAIAVNRKKTVSESWQMLSPALPAGDPAWIPALANDASLPLYLSHPERPYWFDFEAGAGLLYFQFNKSDNDENGPSFQEFADSMMAFARTHPVRDVVIDLRLNSGGNLDVAKAFIKGLGGDSTFDRPGHLFVITGHTTFSAGLYHAAQLKQFTHATFVGEPVGDRLDFWAEGGQFVLPNSNLGIRYSNGFHRYSGKEYPENAPYYESLSVATLDPGIAAPLRATDYFALRDPSLEAIAQHQRASRSTAASPRSSP